MVLSRPWDILGRKSAETGNILVSYLPQKQPVYLLWAGLELKALLSPQIRTVGVFVNERIDRVEELLNSGVIDMAQLHGSEAADYIRQLRTRTGKPVIQAFRITSEEDVKRAEHSMADHILLDAGAGTGTVLTGVCSSSPGGPISGRWAGIAQCRKGGGGVAPVRVDVSPVLRRMGSKIRKWRPLWPQSEREREHDQSKGTLRYPRGQYIPETLMNAVIELEEAYDHYKNDEAFNRELTEL